jgi:hypothetical protein
MVVPRHDGEGRANGAAPRGGGEGRADGAIEDARWRWMGRACGGGGHRGNDKVRVYGLRHT